MIILISSILLQLAWSSQVFAQNIVTQHQIITIFLSPSSIFIALTQETYLSQIYLEAYTIEGELITLNKLKFFHQQDLNQPYSLQNQYFQIIFQTSKNSTEKDTQIKQMQYSLNASIRIKYEKAINFSSMSIVRQITKYRIHDNVKKRISRHFQHLCTILKSQIFYSQHKKISCCASQFNMIVFCFSQNNANNAQKILDYSLNISYIKYELIQQHHQFYIVINSSLIISKNYHSLSQTGQISLGYWRIALILFLVILIIFFVYKIIKEYKFIYLKNIKIYYRTRKIKYTVLAFVISIVNLLIMFYYFQPSSQNASSIYHMQYFLFLLFFTVNQCTTEFDQLKKHLKLYRLQGLSLKAYIFQRISYQFTVLIIFSICNIIVISLIHDNKVEIKGVDSYIILIYAFVFCSFSNLGFFYILTLANLRILNSFIELAFIYHFTLLLFSLGSQGSSLSAYQVYFSGIYAYRQIIDSLNKKSKQNIWSSFQWVFIQILIYFSVYLARTYFIYRSKDNYTNNNIIQPNLYLSLLAQQNQQLLILRVQNVCKVNQKRKFILKNINFYVTQGEIFVIYGANSTGKSTLIHTLLSLQKIDAGSIKFRNGLKIGSCFSNDIIFNQLTFIEHIQFICQIKNIHKQQIPLIIQQIVDDFYFERDKQKRAQQLSGGSLKKLSLALAFIGQPNLLILDEPSLGLDANFRIFFWKMLKRKKIQQQLTIIMTTGDKQEAQFLGDNIHIIGDQSDVQFQLNNFYQITFMLQNQSRFQDLIQTLQVQKILYAINYVYKQIKIKVQKNQLIQSQFIHFLLFHQGIKFQYKILNGSKDSFQPEETQVLNLINLNQSNQTNIFDIAKCQIKALAKKRFQTPRQYIISIGVIIGLLMYNFYQYESIPSIALLFSYYIYYQFRLIRNNQIIKGFYLNAIVFGMNKNIYWITSLLLDTLILFIFVQIVYAKYTLQQFITPYLLVYSMIYVAITYFFSGFSKNYTLYIFLFFCLNGFSFYFTFNLQVVEFPKILNTFYFSSTFINLVGKKQYQLFTYLLYQAIGWYILLFLKQYITNTFLSRRKNVEIRDQQYRMQQDQRRQQFQIQDIQNQSQFPLILDSVFYAYSHNQFVLKKISILLKKGEIFCLIGSNGAGKSTLFNIVTGILKQSTGFVKYFGKNRQKMSFVDQIKVGYCPQSDYLYDILTVQENIAYFGRIKGMKQAQINQFAQKYLRYFDLFHLLKEKVNKLQVGNRRKVSVILAFIGNPSLLFLDEPCTGVDEESKVKLWSLISIYCKRGASAILTTHYISEIQKYCDRIGILKNGKLIAIDNPRQLVKRYSFRYRLIIKYKLLQERQLIRQFIEENQAFYNYVQNVEQRKMIYDFDMLKVDYRLILKGVVKELMKNNKITSIQMYPHNLENVINYIENQSHNKSQYSSEIIY